MAARAAILALLPLLLPALLQSAGCASTDAESRDPEALRGTTWRVVRLAGEAVPPDAGIFLESVEQRFVGSGGVNVIRVPVAIEPDGGFDAGSAFTTKRAGPPEAMRREALLLDVLARADAWALRGGALVLEAGGEPVLRAVRGVALDE